MVSAGVFFAEELGSGGATEFAAPDNEGGIEQATLFEIADESGDGLVRALAGGEEGSAQVGVVVQGCSSRKICTKRTPRSTRRRARRQRRP